MIDVEQDLKRLKAQLEPHIPPVDEVYRKARVRHILNTEKSRRRRALVPMRWFHLTAGIGMFVAALVVAASPLVMTVGEVAMALPLVVVTLAGTGAGMLVQAGPSPRRA